MSTINTAGTSSSAPTFDPNIATQCLNKHHVSLKSVGSDIRLQIKVTNNGRDALEALDDLFKDWTDTRKSLPTRKGKRQIPSVGPGSHEWTLTKHDDFRVKSEQLESVSPAETMSALRRVSNPTWTGCKCKPVETQTLSVAVSQSDTAATSPLEAEEDVESKSEDVPDSWEDAADSDDTSADPLTELASLRI